MKRVKEFLFVVGFTAVFVDAPAHAYLDSGTVSLVLQGAAGACASAILLGRNYIQRVKAFFGRPGANTDKADV